VDTVYILHIIFAARSSLLIRSIIIRLTRRQITLLLNITNSTSSRSLFAVAGVISCWVYATVILPPPLPGGCPSPRLRQHNSQIDNSRLLLLLLLLAHLTWRHYDEASAGVKWAESLLAWATINAVGQASTWTHTRTSPWFPSQSANCRSMSVCHSVTKSARISLHRHSTTCYSSSFSSLSSSWFIVDSSSSLLLPALRARYAAPRPSPVVRLVVIYRKLSKIDL